MDPNWKPVDNGRARTWPLTSTTQDEHDLHRVPLRRGRQQQHQVATLHDGLLYNATNEANFATIGSAAAPLHRRHAGFWSTSAPSSIPDEHLGRGYGGVGAWSRFGGTALPARDGRGLRVLPRAAADQELRQRPPPPRRFVEEQDAQADTRSDFCEGCHLLRARIPRRATP